MGKRTPRVYENWLEDTAEAAAAIRLDSPAWFCWLEASRATRFVYPLFDPKLGYIVGVMTVRKERRERGGWYWSVYRRAAGRIRKRYLGHATAVTQARLAAIAADLLAEPSPTTRSTTPRTREI